MVDETPLVIKFLTAGTSGCIADFATFPLDTAKVRLQIQGEGRVGVHGAVKACVSEGAVLLGGANPAPHYRGLLGTMLTVAKEEGSRALYNGLSAGLQRQMCFASVRLGLYDSVKALYQPIFDGAGEGAGAGVARGAGVCTRVAAGLTTGALAVLVAHPTDVVKVRFQAQTRIPGRTDTRRYKSTIQAYRLIAKETGVRGLWTGLLPNISRNAIINVAEIVCYDIVKDAIISRRLMDDSVPCHVSAAIVAGFSATVVASPVDVVKTRYMNAATGQYSGALHCAVTMARKEGAAAFYKGFAPSFCRLVSWNICMWLTYEQMKRAIAGVRLPSPRPHVDVDVAVAPNAQAH